MGLFQSVKNCSLVVVGNKIMKIISLMLLKRQRSCTLLFDAAAKQTNKTVINCAFLKSIFLATS